MRANYLTLSTYKFGAETEALVVRLLKHIYARKKIGGTELTSLQAGLQSAWESLMEKGYSEVATLVQEIDKLLTTVNECTKSRLGEPYLSEFESQVLVDASAALLNQFYESTADVGYYSVPQFLIDGLRSCIAFRNHELDYLEERNEMYSRSYGDSQLMHLSN